MLVGWSRVLAGDYRDPLVGRHLLIGCTAGVAGILLVYLRLPIASLFGAPQAIPSTGAVGILQTHYLFSGARAIASGVFSLIIFSFFYAFSAAFLLFLMRTLLRKTWAAAAMFVLFQIASDFHSGESAYNLILMLLASGLSLFIIFRFGLLALQASYLFFALLFIFPITTDLSAWYSGIGLTGLAILLAFAFYAFHTSLGGQPLFGRASLED